MMVISGKFCKELGPLSGSPASFGVTPSSFRSMPNPDEPYTELLRMVLAVAAPLTSSITMFPPWLWAITFTDELLPPPTVLLLAPSMSTPLSELGKAPVPAALVPMRLLTMLLLLAALVSRNMPFWLPEIRLGRRPRRPPPPWWRE